MAYVKINDDHLKSYADSIRYAKDGTEYTTTLERARAEIAEDNGYFSDISTAVQSKTGQTEPYDKSQLAGAIDGLVVDPNANLDAYIQGDLVNIVTNASLIASSIFRNTSIISVSMLNATEIGRLAFFNCGSLVNVNLSNNLTTIKESAFQGDNKLEISELPDSLLTIESSAFNGCSKLAITKLPKNLTSIYSTTFSNCTSIPYLDVSEVLQIPVLSNSNAFLGTTFSFYFANQAQLDSWASASNWSALADRFQIKGGDS